MAVVYLRSSDGSDASNGLTWADAKATLAAALTTAGAGGTVYVSHAHAETQATAMTLTSSGTAASPTVVICGNDGAQPPTAVATTATVTTTSSSAMSFAGFAHVYGVTFNCGTGSTAADMNINPATPWGWFLEACELACLTTAAGTDILIGNNTANGDDQVLVLRNSSIRLSAVGQTIAVRTRLDWRGGSYLGTAPTALFSCETITGLTGSTVISGVNLSVVTTALVNVADPMSSHFLFENCKLGAAVAITTGTNPGQGGITVEVINCDSADTNYRYVKHSYHGDITQDIATYRTGGASDGTTGFSRKMVSSANSKFYAPLESSPIFYWNETLGAITITVEVITDNVTLTNAEAWLEIEYLGTSGFPLSVFVSDRAADYLATPANQTSSAASWTTGLGTPVTQKFEVTFTPAEKGLIKARVMLAKASTTMYYDPHILASSGRQFMGGESGIVNEAAQTGGVGGVNRSLLHSGVSAVG